jgi:hypothetical protein
VGVACQSAAVSARKPLQVAVRKRGRHSTKSNGSDQSTHHSHGGVDVTPMVEFRIDQPNDDQGNNYASKKSHVNASPLQCGCTRGSGKP